VVKKFSNTSGSFPDIDIPNVDVWGLLFERKDKDFPDDKGQPFPCCTTFLIQGGYIKKMESR
jgi:hypothetical protein